MHGNVKDLTGQRFGKLVAVKIVGKTKNRNIIWLCKCDCDGKFISVAASGLLYGNTKSCGCFQKERVRETIFKDLTGKRLGMLTVLSMTNKQKQKSTVWIVKCDCGIQKEMSSGNLRISRSCGCQSLRALKDSREKNMLHLEGKVFGKLTVISFSRIAPVGRKGATTTKWNCHCECGSDLEVFGNALSMGVTSSCGCSLRMYLSIGKKFGRWTTLSLVPVKNEYRGPTSYICKCECGTVRKVPAERLQSGRSLSCGCLVADLQKERALKKRQDDPAYDQKRLHRRHLWQCSPAVRFKKAIDEAKRRKIPWNMEQEEYVPFILKPCYYCGASLEDESGAGLDRINNDRTIGYRVSNVLSCCGPCNWARGDRYTSEEFKVMMDALLEYRNDQKNNHR